MLREGLNQIKKQFGLVALREERKTIALFSDVVPSGRTERIALKYAYDSGAMKFLLSAVDGTIKTEYAVLQAVGALKSNALMDEEIAAQLVEDICAVLELSAGKSINAGKSQNDIKTSENTTTNEQEAAGITNQNTWVTTNPAISASVSTNISSVNPAKSFPWKTIVLVAGVLLVIGATIGLSIYSWQIGQWLVGTIVAIAIVLVAVAETSGSWDACKTQIWIIACISVVNVILAWRFPAQYSAMAIPVSLGAVIAGIFCAHGAYDYACWHTREPDCRKFAKFAVAMTACNLAVATSIKGGFSSILLWIGVYLLPAGLIAICVSAIYKGKKHYNGTYYADGKVGVQVALIANTVILALHILLVCICPHFVHSLHAYPQLLEKEPGSKKAVCYCGEEIEVSQWAGDLIHAFSCDQYNMWKPLESTTYAFNAESHWRVCSCGVTTDAQEHNFENGICTVCGYDLQEDPIDEEPSARYNKAIDYLMDGNIGAAAIAFARCGDYMDASARCAESWSRLNKHLKQTIIVADRDYFIWVNQNGTVSASKLGYPEISKWNNIAAITLGMGAVAGLKEDGTVVVTDGFPDSSYLEWRDIVSISLGDGLLLGLKKDGTVLACGENNFGQCDVSTWTDIVSIQASENCSFGVKSDGSVCIAGDVSPFETTHLDDIGYVCNSDLLFVTNTGHIAFPYHMAELNWLSENYADVENVAMNSYNDIALLCSDGEVFCHHGLEENGLEPNCTICSEVNSWRDIHQLATLVGSHYLIVGVRNDGSLMVAGEELLNACGYELFDFSEVRVKIYP